MGLDMYLSAERYVSGYEHSDTEEQSLYRRVVAEMGAEAYVDPETPSLTVSLTVAYWRKANQIHAWFVENVQEGKDECQRSEVSREQLTELRDLCKRVLASSDLTEGEVLTSISYPAGEPVENRELGQVLADPAVAQELLPTASGFFFGGSEYDSYYYDDLKSTVAQIDRVLEMPRNFYFEYRASW